jgi:hypothetical protein
MVRALIVVLCVFSVLLWSGAGAAGVPSEVFGQYPLRFAVIGDRTGGHQPGVYGQIVEEIQRLKPDFVLSVGDMIEGNTGDTLRVKAEWEEYTERIKPWTMPVYLAPGNHDIWDEPSLELYERYVGKPHYSFDIRGIHFVILDTSRYPAVDDFPEQQVAWLVDDLSGSANALYTVVVFHHPYWMNTIVLGEPDALHELLVEHGVDAVFTGHYHDYFSGKFDGLLYTGVGSSGGWCTPGPTGVGYHFVWVTVDGDGISIAPIQKDAVLPWDVLTADEHIFVEQIQDEALTIEKPIITEGLLVGETEIALKLRNLLSDVAVNDTLRWKVPKGWTVTPETMQVQVAARDSHVARFAVQSAGPPYPTPTVSLNYPYAEGKEFRLERDLPLSRTAYAHRADEAPTVDGQLTEGIWKEPVTRGFAPDGSAAIADPVSFYFAWDDSSLYVAARCDESRMDLIAATFTDHDGAVYGEDCVGYFLQPETADGPAFQIYFNPLGAAFDQRITVENQQAVAAEREWNGVYEIGTDRDEDYWAIEARIPLDQLGTAGESGKAWAVNFRRKQRRLNTSIDWLVPIGYDPRDYGVLLMK